jgi:hypothetical protein
MWNLCRLIWWVLGDLFRARARLEAEILVLRPDQRSAAERAKEASSQQHRPIDIRWLFSTVPRCSRRTGDRQAGHRDPLAPGRVQSLLAAEIDNARGTAEGGAGDTPIDP